jgi:Arc/MetJ family transcription regulator
MLKTIEIEYKFIAEAREYSGIEKDEDVARAAMIALIHREASYQLLAGGTDPDVEYTPRHQRSTEPIDVSAEALAAMKASMENDPEREDEIEELRQFDEGTHPAQRSPEAYDAWARAKVQKAIDDPRPLIPHEVVKAYFTALLAEHRSLEDASIEEEVPLKVNIEVDEALLAKAREYTGIESDYELIGTALGVLAQQQVSLASLREAMAESGEVDMSIFASKRKDEQK